MKDELVEALKMLARGRVDAAKLVADILLPDAPEPASVIPEAVEAKPKKK
jgi:hypothetical protein